MNQGSLVFPYNNNGITIENMFNDASLRTLYYTGSLNNASDPALKEQILPADLNICYRTLEALPLRTYSYTAPYCSTFRVRDVNRIGFITKEVEPYFPNSITVRPFEEGWGPSSIQMLDAGQIKYTHMGVTQALMWIVEELEGTLAQCNDELRRMLAQRNSVL